MKKKKQKDFYGLPTQDLKVLAKLNSPAKVQDYINSLKVNFSKKGDTLMSPVMVLETGMAHCMEGALLAAVAFWYHGQKPLLLDLQAVSNDADHVVTLFKQDGLWGAVSKTNHAVLRFREPVYKTIRELAMSYFHEYFLNSNGKKTLRAYSKPFDLRRYKDKSWIISKKDLWHIADDLDASKHYKIAPKKTIKKYRLAEPIEIKAGKLVEQS